MLKKGLLGLHSESTTGGTDTGISKLLLLEKVRLTSTVLDLGPKLVGGSGSRI
jgi:hypothetical protein